MYKQYIEGQIQQSISNRLSMWMKDSLSTDFNGEKPYMALGMKVYTTADIQVKQIWNKKVMGKFQWKGKIRKTFSSRIGVQLEGNRNVNLL